MADPISQPVKRFAAALSADLDVISLHAWGAHGVGGREVDNEQAILRELRGLGERLSEGELRLEAPRWQVAPIETLARVLRTS